MFFRMQVILFLDSEYHDSIFFFSPHILSFIDFITRQGPPFFLQAFSPLLHTFQNLLFLEARIILNKENLLEWMNLMTRAGIN